MQYIEVQPPVEAILYPQKATRFRKSPCDWKNFTPLEIYITCQSHQRDKSNPFGSKNSLQQSSVQSLLIFGRMVHCGNQCPRDTQDLDFNTFSLKPYRELLQKQILCNFVYQAAILLVIEFIVLEA